jgi:hypothetical protein
MTRAERIQIVLDLLRGTKDRPDLRQLEAELFLARGAQSEVPAAAPASLDAEPLTPVHSASREQPIRSDILPSAARAEQPASLGFLMDEHPAILAQQMMGQSEEERREALAACSGPLARQLRYLLTHTS